MLTKKSLITVLILVVLVAALVAVYFITRPETTAGQKSFTFEVVHSDGSTKTFQCRSELKYVGEALQAEGIIDGEEGAYGLYVKVVDGEKAVYEEDSAYWAFYEGDTYASLGIDQTPIQEGGVYKMVYTKG